MQQAQIGWLVCEGVLVHERGECLVEVVGDLEGGVLNSRVEDLSIVVEACELSGVSGEMSVAVGDQLAGLVLAVGVGEDSVEEGELEEGVGREGGAVVEGQQVDALELHGHAAGDGVQLLLVADCH